jgi:hypothetical protein
MRAKLDAMTFRPIAFALWLVLCPAALADDASPTPNASPSAAPASPTPTLDPREQASLQSFDAANPACREWSDGCAICRRDAADAGHCSTPGIACQPSAVACTDPRP